MKFYAGIGSRRTPEYLKFAMSNIAKQLGDIGYVLRSGGATGADTFFERGARNALHKCEIYLPWKNFNDHSSLLYEISGDAIEIAAKFHPSWDKLSDASKKLMARNSYQVLGYDLKTPVDFVICWTPEGKETGGTGQAMRIARSYKIPIINMDDLRYEIRLNELIRKINQT